MKDFLKTVAGIIFFIAVAIGILIFLRDFNQQPSVILTDTECEPPCWHGIHPGRTNSSQVYAILESLKGVNKETIMGEYDKDDKLNKIYWYFERPVQDNMGSIQIDNDSITAITILTPNSLKLAELFNKLGQPEEYWTEIKQGEYREFLEVILLYPTKGYLVDVTIDIESNTNQAEIKTTTPVLRVTYFSPEMFQELLQTRTLINKPANLRADSFQPWSGFGIIFFERK